MVDHEPESEEGLVDVVDAPAHLHAGRSVLDDPAHVDAIRRASFPDARALQATRDEVVHGVAVGGKEVRERSHGAQGTSGHADATLFRGGATRTACGYGGGIEDMERRAATPRTAGTASAIIARLAASLTAPTPPAHPPPMISTHATAARLAAAAAGVALAAAACASTSSPPGAPALPLPSAPAPPSASIAPEASALVASSAPPSASAPPPVPTASAGTRVLVVKDKPFALGEPPRDATGKKPLVTFLHGMCAIPEWECPIFRSATDRAWLVCPRGPVECQGEGAMWVGTPKALTARTDAATTALLANDGDFVDDSRRALVGYSLGAFAALPIVTEQPGKFSRLMLVNAAVSPSKAQLEKAGVVRIAFVAGDRDPTAAAMRSSAQALAKAGVAARFFSLEKTGHYFDATSEGKIGEAMGWLLEGW